MSGDWTTNCSKRSQLTMTTQFEEFRPIGDQTRGIFVEQPEFDVDEVYEREGAPHATADYAEFAVEMSKQSYQGKDKRAKTLYFPMFDDRFVYNPGLSNDDAAIYASEKLGLVYIAYRGTDVHDSNRRWKDLAADAWIATGLRNQSARFKAAKALFDEVRWRYKGYDIIVTGHSLGGAMADYVSVTRGVYPITFNEGRGIMHEMSRRGSRRGKHYLNRKDPVSHLGDVWYRRWDDEEAEWEEYAYKDEYGHWHGHNLSQWTRDEL